MVLGIPGLPEEGEYDGPEDVGEEIATQLRNVQEQDEAGRQREWKMREEAAARDERNVMAQELIAAALAAIARTYAARCDLKERQGI